MLTKKRERENNTTFNNHSVLLVVLMEINDCVEKQQTIQICFAFMAAQQNVNNSIAGRNVNATIFTNSSRSVRRAFEMQDEN